MDRAQWSTCRNVHECRNDWLEALRIRDALVRLQRRAFFSPAIVTQILTLVESKIVGMLDEDYLFPRLWAGNFSSAHAYDDIVGFTETFTWLAQPRFVNES